VCVPCQPLLEIKDFLNYALRTYPFVNSYLKDLYLIIDAWGEDRVEAGWKATGSPTMVSQRVCNKDL
jgi:hypothetical protein